MNFYFLFNSFKSGSAADFLFFFEKTSGLETASDFWLSGANFNGYYHKRPMGVGGKGLFINL